jgi:enamine deaminase RidA (YjgF/YER057c/UK114 family)
MNADERLAELGLSLPMIPALPGQTQPMLESVVVHGDLAYLSGIGPIGITGIVGGDCSVDEAFAAARVTALLMLRRIHDAFGSLDVVDHWVKVLGFIRSAPGFAQQPAVLNGFTALIIDIYGIERGRCARSAIGTSELPANIPVEVEAIVALRPGTRKETHV